MSKPDQKTTLREFHEYVALSYESPIKIAARIGVKQATTGDWLSGRYQPNAKSLAKLRRFLDEEAKRPAQGTGSGRSSLYRSKSSSQPSKCDTLGFVRSAGKRGARSVSSALLHSRAPARSAARPAPRDKVTRKPSGRGMGDFSPPVLRQLEDDRHYFSDRCSWKFS
jgi:transcriptional regulator with XRE-family HTH domain